jgi:hypothetical protein
MRLAGSVFVLTPILLVSAVSDAAGASSGPSKCANPLVMGATLSQFIPPNRQVYLRLQNPPQPPGSTPIPDPLLNHLYDFFDYGYQTDVDPRLAPAIAGAESTMGTQNSSCVKNNNAWGLDPDHCRCAWGVPGCDCRTLLKTPKPVPTNCQCAPGVAGCGSAFSDLTFSISVEDTYLSGLIFGQKQCTSIKLLDRSCHYCVNDSDPNLECWYPWPGHPKLAWWQMVQGYFGSRASGNLGGDPNTKDLSYKSGYCAHADCNGDGVVTIDEILLAINVALGNAPLSLCPAAASACQPFFAQSSLASGTGAAAAQACSGVTVGDLTLALYNALNGPGDPTPLPTLKPSQMQQDSCDGCDCTQCQSGHCGRADCTFCESGNCYNPCAGCVSDATGQVDPGMCPCGDAGCSLCWTPTPLPPTLTPTPEPTPTNTAVCSFNASPREGHDCQAVLVTGTVQPPFNTQVDRITVTQSLPSLPSFDFQGSSLSTYINGSGDFTINLTAYYPNGDRICTGSADLFADGMDPWTFCGILTSDPNPGLVTEPPPTPAPQYTCHVTVPQGFNAAPFDGYMNISPPYAASRVTNVTITQRNPEFQDPITFTRTGTPGEWVAHLCYDGDDCRGPYTLTFNAMSGSTVLGTCDQQITFAGCSSWPCDPRCAHQCTCPAGVCNEASCVENQQ